MGIKNNFKPLFVKSRSAADYKLRFKMDTANEFYAGAEIQFKNESADNLEGTHFLLPTKYIQ